MGPEISNADLIALAGPSRQLLVYFPISVGYRRYLRIKHRVAFDFVAFSSLQ
jgi:hypothetical protein